MALDLQQNVQLMDPHNFEIIFYGYWNKIKNHKPKNPTIEKIKKISKDDIDKLEKQIFKIYYKVAKNFVQ